MKRILIVCAALLLCGMAAARGRGLHRVASCNIRVALPQDEEGGNGWSARKYVCERVMKRCKADIYCLQEVTVGQYEDMCRMFPGYFVFGYPGPETDALPDREYHGIAKNLVMFSKRRYEMTGAGVYWLSDTPLVGGLLVVGARARPRHVNWGTAQGSPFGARVPGVVPAPRPYFARGAACAGAGRGGGNVAVSCRCAAGAGRGFQFQAFEPRCRGACRCRLGRCVRRGQRRRCGAYVVPPVRGRCL